MVQSIGQGVVFSRAAAEAQLNQQSTDDELKALQGADEDQIRNRNAAIAMQLTLKSISNDIGTAMAAASCVTALCGLDQAGQGLASSDAFKANAGSEQSLANVQLGSDGPTVGQRFSHDQIHALQDPSVINNVVNSHSNLTGSAREAACVHDFEHMGFSEGESKQIYERANERPWTIDNAAYFAWQNRMMPGQSMSFRNQVEAVLQNQYFQKLSDKVVQLNGMCIGNAEKMYQDRAKTEGKIQEQIGVAKAARGDTGSRTQQQMGEVALGLVRLGNPRG
jgi:hypothetical protein